MSKSILYARNLETEEINGVQGQIIDPDVNTVGQVLKITSVDPKTVAFEDASGTPSAVGFPDGYVLKIVDNATNTVNWEPDAGPGSTVPFVLTGENINAFVVRADNINPPLISANTTFGFLTIAGSIRSTGTLNCLGDDNVAKFQVATDGSQQMMRVDTVDKQVFLSANRNTVDGSDDEKKLGVYTNADGFNPIFQVSTENNNTGVFISGQQAPNKFLVKTETGDTLFKVDTVNDIVYAGGNTNIIGNTLINGVADKDKFIVGTNLAPVFTVDTDNQNVLMNGNTLIQGAQDKDKFVINDGLNKYFGVDTDNSEVYVGSTVLTAPTLFTMRPSTSGRLKMIFQDEIHLESTNSCELRLNQNDTGVGFLRSQQLTVFGYDTLSLTALNSLDISSPQTIFDATQPIPKFSADVFPSQYTDAKEITNKLYVDDKVGGIASGISDSATAIGNVLGDQLLNPLSFLPMVPAVPPNYLKPGQSYQLTMSGSATFSNGDAFVVSLKSGAVTLGSISIVVPNVAGGGQTFELEGEFTIRSVTLGLATIVCSFDFTYNDGQNFIGKRSLNTSTTLDTTVANSLEVFVNFSSGQVTDNITTQLFILKKVVDV